jgi:polysaccharide biosynthesis transport protein
MLKISSLDMKERPRPARISVVTQLSGTGNPLSTSRHAGSPIAEGGRGRRLERLIRVAKRNMGLILLCVVLAPAAALAVSLLQTKQYTASSSLLFRDPGLDQKFTGAPFFQEGEDEARLAATNLRLVSLDSLATRTARELDEPGFGREDVANAVEVAADGPSDVVTVKATDRDPRFAAELANTYAREYIAFRREADRAKVREAQALVQSRLDAMTPEERASRSGQELEDSARQLALLAALQTGNAELVQRARPPTSASSPKPVRSVALGLMLGLLLAIGLTLIREQLDRRLRDDSDVTDVLNVPVLAAIPENRASVTAVDTPLAAPDTEAFRMLRTNLRYFNVDEELNSILVMSAIPKEGKTTISWNLARAEARAGKRVLYIEADLRRPVVGTQLGIAAHGGLTLVLAGVTKPGDAITTVSGVDVITAGPPPPNPAELIESQRMRKLIQWGEDHYDRVIVDTPPAAVVADAIPLVPMVSGVVIVVRLGYSRRDAVERLHTQLSNVDAPVLGVVLNGTVARKSDYQYGQRPGLFAEEPEADLLERSDDVEGSDNGAHTLEGELPAAVGYGTQFERANRHS